MAGRLGAQLAERKSVIEAALTAKVEKIKDLKSKIEEAEKVVKEHIAVVAKRKEKLAKARADLNASRDARKELSEKLKEARKS